jgi:2-aminoadipate transaminase
MRLNFSGVHDDDIREGVRRIGMIVREQVALYGTLTGVPAARSRQGAEAPHEPGTMADVLPLLPREPRRGAAQGE